MGRVLIHHSDAHLFCNIKQTQDEFIATDESLQDLHTNTARWVEDESFIIKGLPIAVIDLFGIYFKGLQTAYLRV